ncbi:MAG: hypothetical protein NTY77_19365 [Elusimicrobia bacterium]|nr:hypothetical protein [Elusimicrobiota bacterium]
MKRLSIVAAAVLLSSVPASAYWLSAGASEARGTQNYNGVNAFGQAGTDAFSLKPMFQSFHSDVSGGAFNTYSLRVGYDSQLLALGLTGGATPRVNGYDNQFGAVDATLSLTPTGEGARQRINGRPQVQGPAEGAGLARIDIGGSAVYTRHSERVGSAGQALGSATRLGQTDLTASAGVALLTSLLSVDITKSVYDKKPADLDMRAPRVENIVGLAQVAQGFPNSSVNAKVIFGLIPFVKPYAGYTRTTFMAGVPSSQAYTAGLTVPLGIVAVSANWEHYVQAGQSNRDFFGFGAGLRL